MRVSEFWKIPGVSAGQQSSRTPAQNLLAHGASFLLQAGKLRSRESLPGSHRTSVAEPRLEPRQSDSRVCACNHRTIFCNKYVFAVMLIRTTLCTRHMCSDILSMFLLCNVPRILWAHSWCPLMIMVWEFRNNFQSILGTRHYIIFIIQWSLNSGA